MKKFIFEMSDYEDELLIVVSNTLEDEIKFDRLIHFFDKGYSTKGGEHGIGLFNAKNIIEKYSGDISVRSYVKEGEAWITMKCILKRRRQK